MSTNSLTDQTKRVDSDMQTSDSIRASWRWLPKWLAGDEIAFRSARLKREPGDASPWSNFFPLYEYIYLLMLVLWQGTPLLLVQERSCICTVTQNIYCFFYELLWHIGTCFFNWSDGQMTIPTFQLADVLTARYLRFKMC